MTRYVAVCKESKVTDDDFKGRLDRIRKWRPDRRTWIIKAYYARDEGKIIVECETPDKAHFEQWLADTEWPVDDIYEVHLIHEAGTIWPL